MPTQRPSVTRPYSQSDGALAADGSSGRFGEVLLRSSYHTTVRPLSARSFEQAATRLGPSLQLRPAASGNAATQHCSPPTGSYGPRLSLVVGNDDRCAMGERSLSRASFGCNAARPSDGFPPAERLVSRLSQPRSALHTQGRRCASYVSSDTAGSGMVQSISLAIAGYSWPLFAVSILTSAAEEVPLTSEAGCKCALFRRRTRDVVADSES